jgi:formylglycine-generating enzyme required for sulfatase activity
MILIDSDTPVYFNFISPGTFQMGSSPDDSLHEPDEAPVHEVTITEGFYLGIYEVTQQ